MIEEVNYKAFVMAAGSMFALIASMAMTIYGVHRERAVYFVPGIMASALFLTLFTIATVKTMKVRNLLTITREGIHDSSSLSGMGFLSFDDIKEFLIVTAHNRPAIAVVPKDTQHFLSQLTVVKRRVAKRNISQQLPPVLIMADMAKDMEPEDILSLLNKRLSDYSRLFE